MYAHLRHVEQLALRALVISDVLRAEHIRRLTRLDQLQLFPIEKAVLECEHGFAAVVTLDRHADNLVLADILAVAVMLSVFLIAEVEAGVILAVADLIDLIAAELRQNEVFRVLFIGVDRGTVCTGDTGCIVRSFVTALNLERGNTGLDQLRNVLDHAHILGVIQVGAASVLLNREELPRTLLLHQRIIPAARLCTCAVVGVAAGHVLRDQAAAGVRNAHGTMNEGLNLEFLRGFGTDFGDLLKGKLTREHDTLGAFIRPVVCRLVVKDAGLSRDVHRNLGRVSARHAQHAYVRDDECVRACVLQQLQIGWKRRKVAVGRHNIDCNVALDAVRMRVSNALAQRVIVKVGCSGTHAEARSGHIDRIRAVGNAKPHFVQIACGRQ